MVCSFGTRSCNTSGKKSPFSHQWELHYLIKEKPLSQVTTQIARRVWASDRVCRIWWRKRSFEHHAVRSLGNVWVFLSSLCKLPSSCIRKNLYCIKSISFFVLDFQCVSLWRGNVIEEIYIHLSLVLIVLKWLFEMCHWACTYLLHSTSHSSRLGKACWACRKMPDDP